MQLYNTVLQYSQFHCYDDQNIYYLFIVIYLIKSTKGQLGHLHVNKNRPSIYTSLRNMKADARDSN